VSIFRTASLDSVDSTASVVHDTVNTAFVDQAPAVGSSSSVVSVIPVVYPTPSLTDVLSRNYEIATFQWSGASASGACIAAYVMPDMLFAQPTIWAKLQRFRYFRADVKVSLRINSTPYHYGALLVSWLPNYDPTWIANNANGSLFAKFGNVYTQSSNPSAIVSASASDPVEFVMPCKIPTAYIDLASYNGTGIPNIGCFVIRVVSPLRMIHSTTNPVLDVSVFASFERPQVAGFLAADRPAYVARGNLSASVIAQSAKREAVTKSEKHLASGVALAASAFTGGLKDVPVIGTAASFASKVFGFIGGGLKQIGYDKPRTREAATVVKPVPGMDMSLVDGLDSSLSLATMVDNQIGCDSALFKLHPDEGKLAHLSTRYSLFDITTFTDTLGPDGIIATYPVTPGICAKSTSAGPTAAPYVMYPTLAAHTSMFFQWWRGDMKFMLRFIAPKLATARVRISWVPDFVANAGSVSGGFAGDVISQVVDIVGDTTVEFVVPYLSDAYWKVSGNLFRPPIAGNTTREIPDAYMNGTIVVSVVNRARLADVETGGVITLVAFNSITPNFQFAGPTVSINNHWFTPVVPQTRVTSSPSRMLEAPIDLAALVPASSTIDSGVCMGEQFVSFTDMAKRYQQVTVGTGVIYPPQLYSGELATTTSFLNAIFMAHRGSIRYKVISSDTVPAYLQQERLWPSGRSNSNAGAAGWNSLAPLLPLLNGEQSVEVPFYVPCVYTMDYPSLNTSGRFAESRALRISRVDGAFPGDLTKYAAFVARGDDYDVGILCAPPAVYTANITGVPRLPGQYPY